jgi:hypothetical protein
MPVTYEAIATTTTVATTTTISFSNISQLYTDLRIVLNCPGVITAGNNVRIEMNNDSANFGVIFFYGDTNVFTGNAQNTFGRLEGNSGVAQNVNPFLATCDVMSYRDSTKYKTLLSNVYGDAVDVFLSTAAVTQLTLKYTGTFRIGTVATLYGIKAA